MPYFGLCAQASFLRTPRFSYWFPKTKPFDRRLLTRAVIEAAREAHPLCGGDGARVF